MSQKCKTETGIEVTLTGQDDGYRPSVLVQLTHPKLGTVKTTGEWATLQGRQGVVIYAGGMHVCVTVPRESFDAALAEAVAIGEQEIADLKAGRKMIELHYHDGEYLSGEQVFGRAARLLCELGLAEEVSGWGTHVTSEIATQLGSSFTYDRAVAVAQPGLDACKAKKEAAASERATKFEEARATGKRVVLGHYLDECDGTVDECTWDSVSEFAAPDGTTVVERTHTF